MTSHARHGERGSAIYDCLVLICFACVFQTLEISGRFKVLLGQAMKGDEPPLAMFALCCPFGPLPLLDVPPRDYTFKSKHKMDLAPVSMDPRLVPLEPIVLYLMANEYFAHKGFSNE